MGSALLRATRRCRLRSQRERPTPIEHLKAEELEGARLAHPHGAELPYRQEPDRRVRRAMPFLRGVLVVALSLPILVPHRVADLLRDREPVIPAHEHPRRDRNAAPPRMAAMSAHHRRTFESMT